MTPTAPNQQCLLGVHLGYNVSQQDSSPPTSRKQDDICTSKIPIPITASGQRLEPISSAPYSADQVKKKRKDQEKGKHQNKTK